MSPCAVGPRTLKSLPALSLRLRPRLTFRLSRSLTSCLPLGLWPQCSSLRTVTVSLSDGFQWDLPKFASAMGPKFASATGPKFASATGTGSLGRFKLLLLATVTGGGRGPVAPEWPSFQSLRYHDLMIIMTHGASA
jgi:hypothetical protein